MHAFEWSNAFEMADLLPLQAEPPLGALTQAPQSLHTGLSPETASR
jgi:hypothetical protein